MSRPLLSSWTESGGGSLTFAETILRRGRTSSRNWVLAHVFLTETSKTILKTYSPVDQGTVAWAISVLEDDATREANKIDLSLVEDGMKVWAFISGSVWLGFVERPDGSVVVIHLSVLSRFRAAQGRK
jgi:hypothetical protein